MFYYSVTDGLDPAVVEAKVTVTVFCPPPPPSFNYTWEAPPGDSPTPPPPDNLLLNNFTDPNCPSTMGVVTQQPSSGSVSVASNGSYIFTPAPGWFGE